MKYLHKTEQNWLVKNEQRKLLTNISWKIFVELHVGGADFQSQQVCSQPVFRLWERYRGFIVCIERLCCLLKAWQCWSLENSGARCKQSLHLSRYLNHHHEGVRVETELWSSWVFQADCRAGMCRGVNEVARVTCECFMAETDTHVLRIVNGIWVGKIVFLIFRICVNKNMFHKHFSNSSFLKWWFYTCLK